MKGNLVFKKGFTLLEVLVALIIFGVSLMLIIELFSGGLRSARISEEYTKGIQYARIKMEEIRLTPPLEEGVIEGKFDDFYKWRANFKKVDVLPLKIGEKFDGYVKLFKIDLDIFWRSGSKERSVTLESYQVIKEKESE